MISNEQVKRAIEDCARANHTVSVRDISYVLLSMQFDDSLVAYKCIFGNDYDYNQDYHATYDQTSTMTYLKSYVGFTLLNDKKKKTKTEDISFEENKEAIINLIKETKEKEERGEIDAKQSLDLQTKLRVTLNDKFRVQSDDVEQIVQVFAKYDAVCSRCGAEISRRPISKEEAIEMYNLVEKE